MPTDPAPDRPADESASRASSADASSADASSAEEPSPDETTRSDAPQGEAGPENIPLQGTHQGTTDDPLTSSVRAQTPPDPTAGAERVEEGTKQRAGDQKEKTSPSSRPHDLGTYRLSHDPQSGRHRVRLHPPAEDMPAPGGGFREISRHSSPQEMNDALESGLPDGPRFVVLENTETGERFFDREGATSDNWFAGGRFDQVTLFDREEEAARYAAADGGSEE